MLSIHGFRWNYTSHWHIGQLLNYRCNLYIYLEQAIHSQQGQDFSQGMQSCNRGSARALPRIKRSSTICRRLPVPGGSEPSRRRVFSAAQKSSKILQHSWSRHRHSNTYFAFLASHCIDWKNLEKSVRSSLNLLWQNRSGATLPTSCIRVWWKEFRSSSERFWLWR